ncbi:hypothetical protein F5X96DRAFT_643030 [Biscogniauxia mediterranea]|nr:hypothetical protein F5X96DRAFT_643030 [Biscogniauxia mediterranea]
MEPQIYFFRSCLLLLLIAQDYLCVGAHTRATSFVLRVACAFPMSWMSCLCLTLLPS